MRTTQHEIGKADPRNPPNDNAIASRGPLWSLGLGVLFGLEAAWLLGFLCLPLPSAPANLGVVRRGVFLAQFFPAILPQIGFEQSHLGLAIEELSHFENLPQRLPASRAPCEKISSHRTRNTARAYRIRGPIGYR